MARGRPEPIPPSAPLQTKTSKRIGRDPKEKPQGLEDMLPEWMGYGALYLVSVIPVLIALSAIAVLFFSSLK